MTGSPVLAVPAPLSEGVFACLCLSPRRAARLSEPVRARSYVVTLVLSRASTLQEFLVLNVPLKHARSPPPPSPHAPEAHQRGRRGGL